MRLRAVIVLNLFYILGIMLALSHRNGTGQLSFVLPVSHEDRRGTVEVGVAGAAITR